MKNYVIILFCIVLIGQFVYQIKINKDRKKIEEEITKSIVNSDFSKFDSLIVSKEVNKLLPIFNRLYLEMNVAFLKGDDKKLDEVFNTFRKMKLSPKQKEDISIKAFNYYAEKGNEKRSRYYMNQILEISSNIEIRKLVKRTFSVMVLKSDEYLNELLKENKELVGNKRLSSDILLAKIYEYKGDDLQSQKYLNQYKEDAIV